MRDHLEATPEIVGVYPERSNYTVAETGEVEILVNLVNMTASGDYFRLEVLNIPFAIIKILPSQLIFLEHGGKTQVALFLSLPLGSEGVYPLKIQVRRKADEAKAGEAEIELRVTKSEEITATAPVLETQRVVSSAYQARGRVGVVVNDVQFHVAPGEVLSIPVQLTNQSLEDERLTLNLKSTEIPHTWVSVQPGMVELKAGRTQTMVVKIAPPKKFTSRAGRYPFVLEVRSARFSDSPASVDCVLTVTAFRQSAIQLSPLQVYADQPVLVRVENTGNTAETYEVSWEGIDRDLLEFEVLPPPPTLSTPAAATQVVGATRVHQPDSPGSAGMLRVEPGKAGVLQFKARPIRAPLFGGARRYDFQTRVSAPEGQGRLFSNSLTGRSMIPAWALGIFVFVCIISFCVLIALIVRAGKQPDQVSIAETQTAANLTQEAGASLTATALVGLDSDGDGLPDSVEIGLGTNPGLLDTDLDGLSDGDEFNNRKTDPRKADTDGDGLVDGDEITRDINPLAVDTDADGVSDGDEVRIGTNPKSVDTDEDGWIDNAEVNTCHSPTDPDTDDDGIPDGKDLEPCDKNNPSLTQTALAGIPSATPTSTSTSTSTTIPPTLTPTLVPLTPTPTTVPPSYTPTAPAWTSTPTPTIAPPAPSLQGFLLFSSNREGRPQIYVQDMTLGRIIRLTVGNGDDSHPVWSPNGRMIAFTSNRDGDHDIYVMDANGANVHSLTNNDATDHYPSWSPDGDWIAFSSNRDGDFEIYIMRVDGSDVQNISDNPANDTQPSWGRTSGLFGGQDVILFVSDRDGNQEIYSMQPDGSSVTNLTNNGARDSLPELSTDGSRIAFTSDREGDADILVMDTDGSDVVNLTADSPAIDEYPAWSSDDQWIAYASTAAGDYDIFVIKADGSVRYNITEFQADDRDPAWR
jgi:Tol biopolymer transport system component